MISKVCVYCASSDKVDGAYHDDAYALGQLLARADVELVYGGGARGSMGQVANGALAEGGRVIGVLPKFMDDLEWGHPGLSNLELVETMHERKHRMLVQSDAVVALPGGCGTFEELFEALTFKRLGLFFGPIILLNTRNYFAPCIALLEQCVEQGFMGELHATMWQVVDSPHQVLPAIDAAPAWSDNARQFAVQGKHD